MSDPVRGDVWVVDLGLAGKRRPAVILSIALDADDRALFSAVGHTTSPRGTRFEVSVRARFLRPGVFDAQNLFTLPGPKYVRKSAHSPTSS